MDPVFRHLLNYALRLALAFFVVSLLLSVVFYGARSGISGSAVAQGYAQEARDTGMWQSYQSLLADGGEREAALVASTIREGAGRHFREDLVATVGWAVIDAFIFLVLGLLQYASRGIVQSKSKRRWLMNALILAAGTWFHKLRMGYGCTAAVVAVPLVLIDVAYPKGLRKWTLAAWLLPAALWAHAETRMPREAADYFVRYALSAPVYHGLLILCQRRLNFDPLYP